MLDLLALVVVAFSIYFLVVLRPTGVCTANAIFVYIQLIMAVGTFPQLDAELPADVAYGWVVAWSLLAYLGVSAAATLHRPSADRPAGPSSPRPPEPSRLYVPTTRSVLLIGLSVLIVLGYFYAVGYSAFLSGLHNALFGGRADVASQRLDSYSGPRYLFPGYVNQFKNALLPALVVVIFTYWHKTRRPAAAALCLLAAPIALFGLLGTGQRGAFIQFAFAAGVYMYLLNGRRFPRATYKVGAGALGVVVVSTIALGRSNVSLSANAGLTERASRALWEFVVRVFLVQQKSAVDGFRYIYQQPVQWGREWAQGLLGILPGRGGSDLPNRIFASLYGTDRGTAPPSLWGSIYHNFGFFGVAVAPVLLAIGITWVSRQASTSGAHNSLELMGIAGVSTTIGFWAAGGPDALLNAGLAVYVFLWLWGIKTRSTVPTAELGEEADRSPVSRTRTAGRMSRRGARRFPTYAG